MRRIVLAVSALLLVWQIVSHGLSAYLAEAAPETALRIRPQQPTALVNLADRTLNASVSADQSSAAASDRALEQHEKASRTTDHASAKTTEEAENLNRAFSAFATIDRDRSVDLSTLRGWAESALMNEPLDARALRILGQLANAAKDDADAAKFMQAAARLSLHESVALYWLMRKSTAASDYKTAIYYADALLRTNPGTGPYVVPVLAHFAEQKASHGLLKAVLDGNPPWRGLFFAMLPNSVTDVRTPLDLLLALRASPTPPTPEDIGRYLQFLIGHKFYDLAYYTWLQFLPPEELRSAGLLFNGNFEVAPSGLPFDWVITQGSGVTVDIVPRPDKNDERALLLDFLYGRVDYHSVTQLVLLAPGTYQFDGQYQGKVAGPRGLKWRIVCAGEAATRLGESAMISGVASTWREFAFTFTVPSAECRAQYVQLDLDARMASEQLVSGSIMFDELHISRAANLPKASEPTR